MSSTTPAPVEVLKQMVAMFDSGTTSEAASVIAEDYLDHQGLGDGPLVGVDSFVHVVHTARAGFTSQEVTIEDLFGTDDKAVARIRWRGRRHNGEIIDRQTIDIIRVLDGHAMEHWGTHL